MDFVIFITFMNGPFIFPLRCVTGQCRCSTATGLRVGHGSEYHGQGMRRVQPVDRQRRGTWHQGPPPCLPATGAVPRQAAHHPHQRRQNTVQWGVSDAGKAVDPQGVGGDLRGRHAPTAAVWGAVCPGAAACRLTQPVLAGRDPRSGPTEFAVRIFQSASAGR